MAPFLPVTVVSLVLLAAATAGAPGVAFAAAPGGRPGGPDARAPLVRAACDPQRLPPDAGSLDRVSMQLVGWLRAQERPLVPAQLTDGFVASLGICDRRRNAAQAAQCRIRQMCSRLDAMDPDAGLSRPGVAREEHPSAAATETAAAPPAGAPELPAHIGVAAP